MASTTITWKHLTAFASLVGRIAERLLRLASRVIRGRVVTKGEGSPTADPTPASAQVATDTLAQAVAHLAYLGYVVDPPEPDGWCFARHPLRYDFHLRAFPWGIRLHCAVRTELAVGKSRLEWLEYLNTANERSRITHFSLFEGPWGTYDVRMAAFASVPYSREAFAIVMDMWHDDLDWIRRNRDLPVRTALATDDEEEEEAVTLH